MKFSKYAAVVLLMSGLSFKVMAQQITTITNPHASLNHKPLEELKTLIPASQTEAFAQANPKLFSESRKIFRCSFLTLNNLAKATEAINNPEVLNCLYSLLVSASADQRLRTSYFEAITGEKDNAISISLRTKIERN
jgi:hypothetical protein